MDGREVAQRLAHLLALRGREKAIVQPIVRHHWGAVGRPALGDLVLMMREYQVDAAAMDVEDHPQMLLRHRRALDVPAGTARHLDPAWGRPRWFARLRRLPQ